MKIEIKKTAKPKQIPQVGEAWSHSDSGDVWLRINDEKGKLALPDLYVDYDNCFFSVNLRNGSIAWTSKSNFNGEIFTNATLVVE